MGQNYLEVSEDVLGNTESVIEVVAEQFGKGVAAQRLELLQAKDARRGVPEAVALPQPLELVRQQA